MAIIAIGTIVQYTDFAGIVYGGLVTSNNGVYPHVTYYAPTGWMVTLPLATRDDTGLTPNSYAVLGTAAATRWIPAGNRYGSQRAATTGGGTGNGFTTGRLHKSPPVDITALMAICPWYVCDTALGEIAVGGTGTLSLAIEQPLGTAAGTAKAFTFANNFTVTLSDLQTAFSDVLTLATPLLANTIYRPRCWQKPGVGVQHVIGRPGLGNLGGGTMSGYGGAVDWASSVAGDGADLTQVNTAFAAYTSDTAYEPVILGLTSTPIDSYLIVADSIGQGQDDIFVPSGSLAGSGDAYGNGGAAERAMGIRNIPYINIAKPGSTAAEWATSGYAVRRFGSYLPYCNKGYLALGINDIVTADTAATTIAALTTIYNFMRASLSRVIVATITPTTTSSDGWTTLAGQTVHSYEQKRLDINTWIRSGAVIPLTDVFDFEAVIRDTSLGTGVLFRVDGGPWVFTGGLHPLTNAHTAGGNILASIL